MLDSELKYFEDHRKELAAQHPGRFLVIKGESLVGAYETREEAMTGAVEALGLTDVLIRRAEDSDQLISIPALTYGLIDASLQYSN